MVLICLIAAKYRIISFYFFQLGIRCITVSLFQNMIDYLLLKSMISFNIFIYVLDIPIHLLVGYLT